MIKILIVDDHPIFRYGLKTRLSREEDFDLVGEAFDGLTALDLLVNLAPDVVLLGLHMPNMDGLSVLRTIQGSSNRAKVVVLTASEDRSQFVEALKLGCRGVMNKQVPPDRIVECIRRVNGGEIWLDLGTTTTALMRQFCGSRGEKSPGVEKAERGILLLTPRERSIVQCVAHGLRNKQIAEKFHISGQTVKNHLHNIFDKLCVYDRLELALYALHKGLDVDVNASTLVPLVLAEDAAHEYVPMGVVNKPSLTNSPAAAEFQSRLILQDSSPGTFSAACKGGW